MFNEAKAQRAVNFINCLKHTKGQWRGVRFDLLPWQDKIIKDIFGTVKVGEKGQIVIPKEARQIFDIKSGDTLLVLGDEEQGIAIVKADVMKELAVKILKGLGKLSNGIEDEK